MTRESGMDKVEVGHTSGPWTCYTRDGRISRYVEGSGLTVAEVWSDGTSDDGAEFAANARLIAAAPDLLEAARYAVEKMSNRYVGDPDDANINLLGECVRELRDAIEKAEGR